MKRRASVLLEDERLSNSKELREIIKEADTFFVLGHWDKAYSGYKTAEELNGEGHTYYRLGVLNYHGHGTKKNMEFAENYFRIAFELMSVSAAEGDASSQSDIGCMYFNGYYVNEDKKLAFEFFQKSADQDYAPAQYNLGVIYESNDVVPRDVAIGSVYFKKAAEKGHVGAQYNMGCSYCNGDGVEVNPTTALLYYQMAAEQGDDEALFSIGLLYKNGEGLTKDTKIAKQYYLRAASKGNANASYHLGTWYQKGSYAKKDIRTAIEFLKRAADKGHVKACVSLVQIFQEKQTEDLVLAFKYLLTVATSPSSDDPTLTTDTRHQVRAILRGMQGIPLQVVATETLLVSTWPKSHGLLSEKCKNGILEMFCVLWDGVPKDVMGVVVKWMIGVWGGHEESVVKGLGWEEGEKAM